MIEVETVSIIGDERTLGELEVKKIHFRLPNYAQQFEKNLHARAYLILEF